MYYTLKLISIFTVIVGFKRVEIDQVIFMQTSFNSSAFCGNENSRDSYANRSDFL